jgi:dTDP-glucose 4,6-dehydratase
VDDHAQGLITAFERGKPGETYNFGGNNERRNIDVVKAICKIVDELAPDSKIGSHEKLIRFVTDRPGHDQRYAIDASKAKRELNWTPRETFESGLKKTVAWYLENRVWCEHVQSGEYKRQRLGLGAAK